jgi:inner membrane protein
MPSIPTHFLVGAALGQAAGPRLRGDWRFWAVAMVCSALPDMDVIGFGFGVRYGDLWGHRGMTHSILFAVAIGIVAGICFGGSTLERFGQSLLFFTITCSHGVLDAMTDGGLGIAFFSPFDPTRYFLPWRPIRVSPIGAAFFSSRGVAVIGSELFWVWGPALAVGLILYACRRLLDARLRAESVTPPS